MIYLDNAATTFPKPASVYDEVMRCMTSYCGNPGRGSHRMALAASEAIYEARRALSALFGAPDEACCVFTLNTTYALNIALKSAVTKNCHILISDMEHNSIFRQVTKLRRDGIADFDVFKTFGGDAVKIINDIKLKIRSNTTILICLLSSNICSLKMPFNEIGKLCRKAGIRFIADAAQSAGIHDINIIRDNIDAVCVPSHKGLFGPQGAGAVVFSSPDAAEYSTLVEGGSGSNSKDPEMPRFLPDMFEAGTLPTPAIAGLSKGIDFVVSNGIDEIRRHESELSYLLLSRIGDDRRYKVYGDATGGIVLFNKAGIPSTDVARELDRAGICVRAGFHCAPLAHKTLATGESGAVRVSFSPFNSRRDVTKLVDVLKTI